MSIVKARTRSGEARWIYRYRDPDGRSREKWFKRRADALEHQARTEISLTDGTWTDPHAKKVSFGEWALIWFKNRTDIRNSTKASQESLLRCHVLSEFGGRKLGSIRTSEIDQWVANMIAHGLSPSTARSAHSLLRGALEAAVRDRILPRNPAREIRLPQTVRREMRLLTLQEIHELAAQMDDQSRGMTFVGAYAGLRWGETAALNLKSLDLLRRRITITHSLSEVNGRVSVGPPKTPSSYRSVTVPKVLAEELEGHLARAQTFQDGLIFTAANGQPLRPRNWRRRIWIPAVEASVGPPVRYHDLRHSHVAMLIQQDQHPKLIQERLGHSSIRTTLDIYGHLFRGIDEAAATAIDQLVSISGLSAGA